MNLYHSCPEFMDEFANLAAPLLHDIASHTNIYAYCLLAISLVVFSRRWFFVKGNKLVDAPIVGPNLSIIARYRFFKHASILVQEGYDKFKNTLFKLSGHDILIIPNKYVDELRNLPDHRLSSIQANIDNFEGLYSTTSIMLEGNLHTRTIQTKLTPKLGSLVPATELELKLALAEELPECKDCYVPITAFHKVSRLISHIAARHFVGYPLCRDEEWLSTAMDYSENAFRTIILIRIFPDWAKPIAAIFIPYAWKVSSALRKAQTIIVPVINERRRAEAQAYRDASYQKPNDFLQWMMDEANDNDGQPHKLAHRLLILTLAAVHTTSMAATQALFDLSARPEYIEPLHQEIAQAVKEDLGFKKATLTKMRKLDSFMRESQRLSPPSLLGFKRAVKEPFTLSDGVRLPKGTHLMMPIYPIVVDPAITPDPYVFDGFRHYKRRLLPGEKNKHQFATTDSNNLHFGHGKFSCPGRFLASNTIKLILSHFLLGYDFKLPKGEGRPKNVHLHEYVFPDPEATILLKEKRYKAW